MKAEKPTIDDFQKDYLHVAPKEENFRGYLEILGKQIFDKETAEYFTRLLIEVAEDCGGDVDKALPPDPPFRDFAWLIDSQARAGGTILIPLIALARLARGDADRVFSQIEFEEAMSAAAAEYGGTVRKMEQAKGGLEIAE